MGDSRAGDRPMAVSALTPSGRAVLSALLEAPKVTTGWLIGVLIETPELPSPQRRYFLVAQSDQGRAEWAAVDAAMAEGPVASSPSRGLEPVEAIRPIAAAGLKSIGLSAGAVRALGPRLPRRWMGQVITVA